MTARVYHNFAQNKTTKTMEHYFHERNIYPADHKSRDMCEYYTELMAKTSLFLPLTVGRTTAHCRLREMLIRTAPTDSQGAGRVGQDGCESAQLEP